MRICRTKSTSPFLRGQCLALAILDLTLTIQWYIVSVDRALAAEMASRWSLRSILVKAYEKEGPRRCSEPCERDDVQARHLLNDHRATRL